MKSVKRSYVIYFNGFSLQGEEALFADYTLDSEVVVAGFSYGAQEAFEYVYTSDKRIDRLLLFSPAFFQNQKTSFVRTQLRYFDSDKESYVKQFLENVSYPSTLDLAPYLNVGSKEQLQALLTYNWDKNKIQEVLDRNVSIEVFLGEKDKIIDSKETLAFFAELTTTYYHKDVGHILYT